MSYQAVLGAALRTRWDDEPTVRIANHRDGFGAVEISWATEPVREGWVARRTRVTLKGVAEYRWRYFDLDLDSGEEGSLELGEITGSNRIAELRRQGFQPNLRHLRISFDEHGNYDLICQDFLIDYRPAVRVGSTEPDWTSDVPPNHEH